MCHFHCRKHAEKKSAAANAGALNIASGASLHQQWEPGSTVSGTLMQGGERVTITIFPDGTVDEKIEKGRSGGGSYKYTKKTGGRGGDSIHIQLDGAALGELLSDLVPDGLGVVGSILGFVLGWVPFLLFIGCIWCCCCSSRGSGYKHAAQYPKYKPA
eukprot:SAG31_NODE_22255_length_530_cov_0.925754_1_plen_158_part_10